MEYRAEKTVSEGRELHLVELPFDAGDKVEVTVSKCLVPSKSWPAGYFDATFGGIKDETFRRHPQGEFEKRQPIE